MAKRKWTDEQLLQMLKEANDKYGNITVRKLKEYGLPNQHVFINYFGSFKNALTLSGIKIDESKSRYFDRLPYTDEEMLDIFKYYNSKKYKSTGRFLTNDDIDENPDMPHSSSYCNRFGGILGVFEKLNIDYDDYKYELTEIKQEDMLNKYMQLYRKLGVVPTSRDLDKYASDGGYSCSTYLHHFGSLYSVCDVLDIPISNSMFGNKSIGTDGQVCCSNGEFIIHEFLLEKFGEIQKEKMYNKVVPDNHKKYFNEMRMDWFLEDDSKKYIIEYFGMIGNKDYNKKHDLKIELMEKIDDKSIIFIKIYPKDIYDLDNIFNKYFSYAKDHSEEKLDSMFGFN